MQSLSDYNTHSNSDWTGEVHRALIIWIRLGDKNKNRLRDAIWNKYIHLALLKQVQIIVRQRYRLYSGDEFVQRVNDLMGFAPIALRSFNVDSPRSYNWIVTCLQNNVNGMDLQNPVANLSRHRGRTVLHEDINDNQFANNISSSAPNRQLSESLSESVAGLYIHFLKDVSEGFWSPKKRNVVTNQMFTKYVNALMSDPMSADKIFNSNATKWKYRQLLRREFAKWKSANL
jgi:hypothetical protein